MGPKGSHRVIPLFLGNLTAKDTGELETAMKRLEEEKRLRKQVPLLRYMYCNYLFWLIVKFWGLLSFAANLYACRYLEVCILNLSYHDDILVLMIITWHPSPLFLFALKFGQGSARQRECAWPSKTRA